MLVWDDSKIIIKKNILSIYDLEISDKSTISQISICSTSQSNLKWQDISINMFIPKNMIIKLYKNKLYLEGETKGITNTIRSKVKNYINGLEKGHKLKLSLSGVGYNLEFKPASQGQGWLHINIGYKNSIKMKVPNYILLSEKSIEINKSGDYVLTAESFDLELLSQWLSTIKQLKSSYKDKYKGKGFSNGD